MLTPPPLIDKIGRYFVPKYQMYSKIRVLVLVAPSAWSSIRSLAWRGKSRWPRNSPASVDLRVNFEVVGSQLSQQPDGSLWLLRKPLLAKGTVSIELPLAEMLRPTLHSALQYLSTLACPSQIENIAASMLPLFHSIEALIQNEPKSGVDSA